MDALIQSLYTRTAYLLRHHISPRSTLRLLTALAFVGLAFVMFQIGLLLLVDPTSSSRSRRPAAKALLSPLLGVASSLRAHYVPDKDTFTCISSGKKIPFSQVNDDYCDCESDGSDEPSTNACANAVFTCSDDGKGRVIPNSRINDGVCDCCDGRDEWAGVWAWPRRLPQDVQRRLGRFQSPCQNTCK